MKKSFQLFNYKFLLNIAPANTVWWFNIKDNESPNQRHDHLFSICRVWIRDHKKIVWQVNVGRIQILFANTNQ